MVFFGTYTLINFLMICKLVMETIEMKRIICSSACWRAMCDLCWVRKKRVRSEETLIDDQSEDESDGEIL